MSKKPAKEKWRVLSKYKWSSLPGYLSLRKGKEFIDYKTILDYRGGDNRKGRQAYRQFIIRGVDQKLENPLEAGSGHGIVGDESFIKWIKEKFLLKESTGREQPAVRELKKRFKPEGLIAHYVRLTGKEREVICRRGKKSIERAMLMELLYRFCQITQPEIGRLVGGIDYSAVSQARKRLQNRIERQPELKKKFDALTDQFIQLSRIKI